MSTDEKGRKSGPGVFFTSFLDFTSLFLRKMKRLGLTSRSAITSSSLFARQGNMAGTTMALRFYSEELSTNRIFVGRLPWSIDTDRLKSLFETYGEVIHGRSPD